MQIPPIRRTDNFLAWSVSDGFLEGSLSFGIIRDNPADNVSLFAPRPTIQRCLFILNSAVFSVNERLSSRFESFGPLFFSFLLIGLFIAAPAQAQSAATHSAGAESSSYTETIPSTLIELKMIRVPSGTVTLETPDGPKRVEVDPFWMSRTEIPWEAYDVWVYSLDEETATSEAADAISRPSKPYVLAGDEFGHNGYPALGMTRHAAAEFAQWLSIKTGKTYRLPTPAQWKHACLVGLKGESRPEQLGAHTWHEANADEQTHPVASKQPNALGLYDLLGNAAEWVAAPEGAPDSTPVIRGGSFRSEAAEVSCTTRTEQTSAWNASDPQLPKSQWWLADAPFVGFRLVRVNGQ